MEKEKMKNLIKTVVEKDPLSEDIQKMSLFGSYLRGTAHPESDIDLLVEFYPQAKVGFFKLVDMQEKLKVVFNRNIDLLTPDQLSPHFKEAVLKEAEVVYERGSSLS